jgi:hypothetical protein
MSRERLNTGQKALQINLDAKKYGAFAEIGAGQEIPCRFLKSSRQKIVWLGAKAVWGGLTAGQFLQNKMQQRIFMLPRL